MLRSTTINRKRTAAAVSGVLLLGVTACGAESGGGGGGGGTTLVMGHQLAADTPFDKGLDRFAELVEKKTDGSVTVEVHPNAEIGSEKELFQGMQDGTVDGGVIAPGSIAEFVPEVSVLSMPFLVTSREQRDQIIEGPVAEEITTMIDEQTGVRTVGYFGGGIRNMFFTEPVSGPQDIQGRLFRTQPSEMLTDAFGAVGLEPTVVAYNELYNALQQGVVDGAENESVYIVSQKFYEPAPHILRTQHEVTIRPLMMSGQTLDNLPDDQRQAVLDAAEEASSYERELEGETDDAALKRLTEELGATVTEADTAAMAEKVRPVWMKYAKQWDMVDAVEQMAELQTS
ncbi:tripartite ATP-independent transporter DctP family solute receptor [Haloactinopolyspora alba]|uniref:Tripartite ATP-independent transporter DctP family solute receptor n=1 Tax=Haloactinopolyspora alba TaxID=648780 RepID=A0A2P8E9G3_9ACTN|nr:TRAP transporter substrate-binding protein [Haloactinopolyspora alba]PSL06121.1 tripartite ATP-independent transporter DctP family solute receptor [Haloactinopolyspora alba]